MLTKKFQKMKWKLNVGDSIRTADKKKFFFSKGDTTNWSHKLSTLTEIVSDTIPSYHINKLRESDNETLLKKSELTMDKNRKVMKKIKFVIIQIVFVHHY